MALRNSKEKTFNNLMLKNKTKQNKEDILTTPMKSKTDSNRNQMETSSQPFLKKVPNEHPSIQVKLNNLKT